MNKLSSLFLFFAMAVAMAAGSSLRGIQQDINEQQEDASISRELGFWSNGGGGSYYRPRPTATPNIVEQARRAGLTTLVELVEAAGLTATLEGAGPFTVFAPTNEAFAKLPADTLAALAADTAALSDVLLYHVLVGQQLQTFGNDWRGGGPFVTGAEGDATVVTKRFRASRWGPLVKKVNTANVILSDVRTSNGVVHVIDEVLLPPTAVAAVPAATEAPVV